MMVHKPFFTGLLDRQFHRGCIMPNRNYARRSRINKPKPTAKVKPDTANTTPDTQSESDIGSLDMLTTNDILRLQRTIGNQAVQRLLAKQAQPQSTHAIQRDDDEEGDGGKTTTKTKKDEDVDIKIEDGETVTPDAPKVDVVDPRKDFKDAPVQSDPALLPGHVGVRYVGKSGTAFATGSNPLLNSSTKLGTAFAFKTKDGNGFEDYVAVAKGTKLTKIGEDGKSKTVTLAKDLNTYFTGKQKLPGSKSNTEYYAFDIKGVTHYARVSKATEKKLNYFLLGTGGTGGTTYKMEEADVEEKSAGFIKPPNTMTMFGPDGPKPDDIHQTNLGDCYFQALLMSLANTNPAHIKDMMEEGNDFVTVRFYKQDKKNFVPVYVKVEKTIAADALGDGLYNAGGLWVRMLQKAFAVFAQQQGKYGEALDPSAKQGFEGIDGGLTYMLYGVFYGPNKIKADYESIDGSNPSDLGDNKDLIKYLLQLNDPGKYMKAGEAMNLTVGAVNEPLIKRAKKALLKLRMWLKKQKDPKAKALVNVTRTIEAEMKTALEEMSDDTPTPDSLKKLAKSCADFVTGDYEAIAKGNAGNDAVQTIFEQFHTIKEMGTDNSPNKRMIYTSHAYTVMNAVFKDDKGAAVALAGNLGKDTKTVLKKADAVKSEVTIRNPHHGNSPTAGKSDSEMDEFKKKDKGEFILTLAQFVRNFTRLQIGTVKKT
jgi:hypothetical protein